jgi:hypothetical protein
VTSAEDLGVQPCDGIICATPSGSTAYNLSNGGPVLMWGLDAMAITFVAPHSLHARPLVVGPDLLKICAGQNHAVAPRGARKAPGQKNHGLMQVDHHSRGIFDLDCLESRPRWPERACAAKTSSPLKTLSKDLGARFSPINISFQSAKPAMSARKWRRWLPSIPISPKKPST